MAHDVPNGSAIETSSHDKENEPFPEFGAGPGPALPIEEDIMALARLGEIASIQKLIDEGKADATYRDEQGITPLHWAAIKNHYALCHFLIQCGADVNAKGGDVNATPVLWAARSCNYYIVDLLLRHGADPLKTDDQGFNLIQNATMDGNAFQLLLLLHQDIPVDIPDAKGHTSLMWAAYKGHGACVEVLLRWGASVHATDEQGFTALHWALVKGSYPCIQKLVEYGSDRGAQTNEGKSPETVAKEMSSLSQYHRALSDYGFNRDGSAKKFPLASLIKDRGTFVTRFFLFYPFSIILIDLYIVSWLPVYFGLPLSAVVFFVMQNLSQRMLQWAPSNKKNIQHTPFLAGIFSGTLFWVAVQYLRKILPNTYSSAPIFNILFAVLFSLVLYFYALTMNENPGYIPRVQSRTEQRSLVQSLIETQQFDDTHFCMTCMVRKPIRSKHCRRCNRCVAKQDHHCPWVDNCVAINNHRHFFLYIFCLELGILVLLKLALHYLEVLPEVPSPKCNIVSDEICGYILKDPFTVSTVIWAALQLTWVTMLVIVQLLQVSRAQTTLESMRSHRQVAGPAGAITSALVAGSTSLEDAGIDASGSGPSAQRGRPARNQAQGCFEQWKQLLGLDTFVALALHGSKGPQIMAQRRANPFNRGCLTNCQDFFCDKSPIFGQRQNGEALLDGQKVNYAVMYEAPPKMRAHRGSNVQYEAVGADDRV